MLTHCSIVMYQGQLVLMYKIDNQPVWQRMLLPR